jgi:hypothetical protein
MGKNEHMYWIGTIPRNSWEVPKELPAGVKGIRGQAERGDGGYEHWQIVVRLHHTTGLAGVKRKLGSREGHFEPTRSRAANDYVWKDDTYIEGTRFELGEMRGRTFDRADDDDYEGFIEAAEKGEIEQIPARIRVKYFPIWLRFKAMADAQDVRPQPRLCFWIYGRPGVGKTYFFNHWFAKRGVKVYQKPASKWWDGYAGQSVVVLDEVTPHEMTYLTRFMAIWADSQTTVLGEIKGGTVMTNYNVFAITSNYSLEECIRWEMSQSEAREVTLARLRRRLKEVHISSREQLSVVGKECMDFLKKIGVLQRDVCPEAEGIPSSIGTCILPSSSQLPQVSSSPLSRSSLPEETILPPQI